MTVHMFRVFVGPGPMSISDLDGRINDWIASNGEWEDDNEDHSLKIHRDIAGDYVCHRVDVRFLPDNSKDNLLQKFTDKLENKVDWYRVGYHACTHRDGDGSSGPCNWDDSTEWSDKDVSIPQGVPDFDGV